ncbi:hypothetical protein OQ519_00195 [Pseudomonas lurida]|uniref:hypothetical protein n=1 Tax=Pseudomonas TaxID=286 RepID=UPI000EFEAAA7|nr:MULTISPECIES: hypothetical protein [Pseudomonas]MBD8666374.1 hypothetical protein [Pseudomonas lurida]MCK0547739.1 hypothetical protein [Pseudomonas syringae pv. aptata]UZQ74789.1 hypothetical protein OQ519_00195 [Pseudomonas lurida]
MGQVSSALGWLWPVLMEMTPDDKAENDQWMRGMASSVKEGNWSKDSDVALDEARRLFDAEVDRRKGADAKAGVYLAAITALIPVLVSLLPTLWNDKASKVLGLALLFIFAWAVAYLLRAGGWAFKTLKVSGFTQLGPGELASSWKKADPRERLAKQLSLAVLTNYPLVNKKIDGIKMTHEYLLRAFLSFSLLMVVQAAWPFGVWLVEVVQKLFVPTAVTPLIMCYS